MSIVPVFVASFLLSALTIVVTRPLAVRVGLVDKPGGHKLHEQHVPLVGGIAIYLSVAMAWLLMPQLGLGTLNSIFLGATGLLFVIGLIDDQMQLSVKLRFAAQIVAALLLVYSGVVLKDLGYLLLGELVVLGLFAVPLTIFATVGAINAINMIDGIDGLAGLVSFTSFTLLLVAAYAAGDQRHMLIILCALGGLGGFLMFNLPIPGRARASVFMGDAGSTLVGFILAYLLITMSQGQNRAMAPVAALWIFSVPLMDTLGVMLRRMAMKKSPFTSDRGHIHHLLLDAGFRVRQAVVLLAALQILLGVIGLIAFYLGVPDAVSFAAFLLLFACYASLVIRPRRIVPRFRALHRQAGLTVQGVHHIYVGHLDSATAVADVEALLGDGAEAHPFEIYQIGEGSGSKTITYALVYVGGTDNVKGLLSQLRYNLASLMSRECSATSIAGMQIRQYINRNSRNDRRGANRFPRAAGDGPIEGHLERRVGVSRLVYRSVEHRAEPATELLKDARVA